MPSFTPGAPTAASGGIAAGMVQQFGYAVPSGYLECDGSAVSRTTYAALFAAIGTSFGVGDGSSTFNVPDFRGRSPLGVGTGDATNATAWALADKGGDEATEAHTHNVPGTTNRSDFGVGADFMPSSGGGNTLATASTGAGDGGNMHPVLTVRFGIKT